VNGAREEILRRVRTALGDRPAAPVIPREYRRAGHAPPDVDLLVERFAERVADYRATVTRGGTTTDILRRRGITRIVVPEGFPDAWRPDVEAVPGLVDVPTLDEVSAVVTTCRVAIAETGTIVLDAGAGMGPRALTLVPDYHLVVVRAEQVVAGVPDAIAVLDPTRPLTWISGPSATSDIELDRVEGVHGPRTLDVLIAT